LESESAHQPGEQPLEKRASPARTVEHEKAPNPH
jgi:hypothetical protein